MEKTIRWNSLAVLLSLLGIMACGKTLLKGTGNLKYDDRASVATSEGKDSDSAGSGPIEITGTNLTMICESLRDASGVRTKAGCNIYVSSTTRFQGTLVGQSFQFVDASNSKVTQGFEIDNAPNAEYQIKASYPPDPEKYGWALFTGTFNGKGDTLMAQVGAYVRETSGLLNLYVNFAKGRDIGNCPKLNPCATVSYAISMIPMIVKDPVKVSVTGDGKESNDLLMLSNRLLSDKGRIDIIGSDSPTLRPIPAASGTILTIRQG